MVGLSSIDSPNRTVRIFENFRIVSLISSWISGMREGCTFQIVCGYSSHFLLIQMGDMVVEMTSADYIRNSQYFWAIWRHLHRAIRFRSLWALISTSVHQPISTSARKFNFLMAIARACHRSEREMAKSFALITIIIDQNSGTPSQWAVPNVRMKPTNEKSGMDAARRWKRNWPKLTS
jgi:hypothetical protein